MKESPKLVHVHGLVNLMRGLQPPTWAEIRSCGRHSYNDYIAFGGDDHLTVTDKELALLGLSRDDYENLT